MRLVLCCLMTFAASISIGQGFNASLQSRINAGYMRNFSLQDFLRRSATFAGDGTFTLSEDLKVAQVLGSEIHLELPFSNKRVAISGEGIKPQATGSEFDLQSCILKTGEPVTYSTVYSGTNTIDSLVIVKRFPSVFERDAFLTESVAGRSDKECLAIVEAYKHKRLDSKRKRITRSLDPKKLKDKNNIHASFVSKDGRLVYMVRSSRLANGTATTIRWYFADASPGESITVRGVTDAQALAFVSTQYFKKPDPTPASVTKRRSVRTWTSVAGTNLDARLKSLSGNVVTLETADGRLIKLQKDQLVPEDHAHLR